MMDKDSIMKVLATIKDPELHKPLTELDMIKSVEINSRHVKIEVSLTIPGCPLKKKIDDDIRGAVGQIAGIESVEVVFGSMSEDQRKNLARRIYGKQHQKEGAEGKEGNVAGDFARRVIAVASGKGGVGKSTLTCNLAAALTSLGHKVGVLDADVYGFSVPRILGAQGQPTIIDNHIIPLRANGIQVMSVGFFIDEKMPVVWRGPLLHKTVNQFISDVLWDRLDYLLIDLPPGTGDVTISIAQALPKAEVLVVTTPQPVASHTAGRVAKMAEKTNLTVLGVVENMSYYDNNGHRDYIFGKDGGKNLARELNVSFLGEIPIKTAIRESADNGIPIALSDDSEAAGFYLSIARAIADE